MSQPPASVATERLIHTPSTADEWWRRSVIYQVYPRSFRDSTGDGMGDLPGITAELHHIADLGVDAVWLSPFVRSPQKDAGYDVSNYRDVDPMFGTLADFDALVARADALGLKIIVDLVPNHCSDAHPLFQAALAAGAGSPERELFHFRDGRGENGEQPPNNWQSHFGGSAWTRIDDGQWYLHLFDSSQPDFNWDHPQVRAEFERTLCFWLDRGAGGFRVDVAHALIKEQGLPDWGGRPDGRPTEGFPFSAAPMFGRPEVHDVYRRWREILEEYDGDRILCAEANAHPVETMADWVRADEMHQTFNFDYLGAAWGADSFRAVIERSLAAFDAVGAPTTWVLSNHDISRHTSRFALGVTGRINEGAGLDVASVDEDLGLKRARAATLFTLGLPGGVYLYQGEELGLPDYLDLPDEYRQDPTFFRTGGERIGRDGCRVPLPWVPGTASYGFSVRTDGTDDGAANETSARPWLPQPTDWDRYARSAQQQDPQSTLNLYRHLLSLRASMNLGLGDMAWLEDAAYGEGTRVAAYRNSDLVVVLNTSADPVALPDGDVIAVSVPDAADGGLLSPDTAAWVRLGA
ncbi:glycoside hydrolase family 13 protein [Zhihengliuella flava]|uniref:Alpha-glucosidase n=1 Tax=Zhihengliuella flava TaxID=1285193 RepID=A0A931DE89_9MICC|nr:alpha-glucosidase [Zhihengliuella flava]